MKAINGQQIGPIACLIHSLIVIVDFDHTDGDFDILLVGEGGGGIQSVMLKHPSNWKCSGWEIDVNLVPINWQLKIDGAETLLEVVWSLSHLILVSRPNIMKTGLFTLFPSL